MRRSWPWRIALAGLLWMEATLAAAPSDADCSRPEFATTLDPASAGAPLDARAVWLDGGRLRWPGKPADGRYRLYASERGRIETVAGQRVTGADTTLRLELATEAL